MRRTIQQLCGKNCWSLPLYQRGALHGLRQELGGPQRIAQRAVVDHRHHDDRDVLRRRLGLQLAQHHLPAGYAGHQHVQCDGRRWSVWARFSASWPSLARISHQSARRSRSRFVFTRHFLTERNTSVYFRRCTWTYKCRGRQDAGSDRRTWKYKCRGRQEKVRPGTGREAGLGHAGSDVKKILCGNKDQARSCRSGEKCGLVVRYHDRRGLAAAASDSSAASSGSRIMKVEPSPTALSTVMSPPIIWQKRRLIGRPSPVPP